MRSCRNAVHAAAPAKLPQLIRPVNQPNRGHTLCRAAGGMRLNRRNIIPLAAVQTQNPVICTGMRLRSNCRKGRARQHQQAADCLQYSQLLLQGLVGGIGAGSRPVQGHGRGSVCREVVLRSSKRGSQGEKGTSSGRLMFVRTGSCSGSGSLQWKILPQGPQGPQGPQVPHASYHAPHSLMMMKFLGILAHRHRCTNDS